MEKLDRGANVPGKDVLQNNNLIGDDGKPKPMTSVVYLTEEQQKDHEMQGGQLPKALLGPDPDKKEIVFVVDAEGKMLAGAPTTGASSTIPA